MVLRGGQGDEVIAPAAAPVASPTASTGATGATKKHKKGKHKKAVAEATPATGATGATGGTGPSGPVEKRKTKSAAQIRAERRKKLIAAAKAAGMPVDVFEAKRAGKEVLIFFWEPQGKDDERTNDAVLNVKAYRKGHLVVFRDKISNASKYDGIAQAASLTQTPSMVILYKDKADSAQGFYDAAAINQKIARLSGYNP